MTQPTVLQKAFLEAYYKASNTSQSEDWMQAALYAKQMFNESRSAELNFYDEAVYKQMLSQYGR